MAKRAAAKAAAKASEAASSGWPGAEVIALEYIKPYPRNARTHPADQVTLLASLFRRYGVDQPIVVDEEGMILKGHGRRLAAIEAGLPDFPVVTRHGLSDTEKRALRLADNQVALLAGWDDELLRAEYFDLKSSGFDMPLLGFGVMKPLAGPIDVTAQLSGLKYAVIVECDSEDDQTQRLTRLTKLGFKCRALIS